jgi:hypothetical protein
MDDLVRVDVVKGVVVVRGSRWCMESRLMMAPVAFAKVNPRASLRSRRPIAQKGSPSQPGYQYAISPSMLAGTMSLGANCFYFNALKNIPQLQTLSI